VQESIHNLLKWKIPFSKMLVFNDGREFQSVEQRARIKPQLIPKVIHQVWLGSQELPPAKKYFYRKTQSIYPDYELKLWREENITRENFPLSYDLIMNLIRFNKASPYSKLATVTDIMRHEILFHEGGFWKDAGMNILRPIFDSFLTYKIAIAVDKMFRYRWLQGMCFFANAPKIENMWRVTDFRNLNRMRIYNSYASAIAGPIDFRQFLIG
jgi:mannosyltransferase OCH1-like enzyme